MRLMPYDACVCGWVCVCLWFVWVLVLARTLSLPLARSLPQLPLACSLPQTQLTQSEAKRKAEKRRSFENASRWSRVIHSPCLTLPLHPLTLPSS